MRAITFIIAAILMEGCHGPWNVTGYEPYSPYIGRPLTLKHHAFLFKDNGKIHLSDGSLDASMAGYRVGIEKFKRMSVSEQEAVVSEYRILAKRPLHIAELPPGTTIWLSKVYRSFDFEGGGYAVDAEGYVAWPSINQPTAFTYLWGYRSLDRAPWEDDSTPLNRSAAYLGAQTNFKK